MRHRERFRSNCQNQEEQYSNDHQNGQKPAAPPHVTTAILTICDWGQASGSPGWTCTRQCRRSSLLHLHKGALNATKPIMLARAQLKTHDQSAG